MKMEKIDNDSLKYILAESITTLGTYRALMATNRAIMSATEAMMGSKWGYSVANRFNEAGYTSKVRALGIILGWKYGHNIVDSITISFYCVKEWIDWQTLVSRGIKYLDSMNIFGLLADSLLSQATMPMVDFLIENIVKVGNEGPRYHLLECLFTLDDNLVHTCVMVNILERIFKGDKLMDDCCRIMLNDAVFRHRGRAITPKAICEELDTDSISEVMIYDLIHELMKYYDPLYYLERYDQSGLAILVGVRYVYIMEKYRPDAIIDEIYYFIKDNVAIVKGLRIPNILRGIAKYYGDESVATLIGIHGAPL
jgi:hypothetical protein